ncbi:hypothetical protein Y032_0059g3043 [Ancylostoma ceylanicum]|nr:hypothetical protein Y032_0059g3043 [Ancylostoma ceylanicum]
MEKSMITIRLPDRRTNAWIRGVTKVKDAVYTAKEREWANGIWSLRLYLVLIKIVFSLKLIKNEWIDCNDISHVTPCYRAHFLKIWAFRQNRIENCRCILLYII